MARPVRLEFHDPALRWPTCAAGGDFSLQFISHNLAVVGYVGDIIAVMYLGRIVEYGRADDVLLDPPSGCRLLSRCPAGPLVRDDRVVCRESEPIADGRPGRAACHFAATAVPHVTTL